MRLNSNYQLNAAADAVMIVYELAKRAGNPPRRVRPRRTCSAGSHELRATVWRRSVPTTRGGETEGPEHMAVTSASGGNALSISLAQVEADFDPHVGARAGAGRGGGGPPCLFGGGKWQRAALFLFSDSVKPDFTFALSSEDDLFSCSSNICRS